MEKTTIGWTPPNISFRRIMKMVSLFLTFLLVFPAVGGVQLIPLVEIVSAEGDPDVSVSTEFDFLRMKRSAVTYKDAFDNSSDLNNTWSEVSGVVKDLGYLYLNTTNTADKYVHKNVSLTGTSAMFEMMYYCDVLKAQDVFQMNLTVNRTDDVNCCDNLAIGNEYNVPTVWYKNAAGNASFKSTTQTFYDDTWYVCQIYINDNDTVDFEWRWKSNFTLMDSCYIDDANLSSAADVGLMNISNGQGVGGQKNYYTVEYAFLDGSTDMEEGKSSESTSWAPLGPSETRTINRRIIKPQVDANLNLNSTDMSGGWNATEHVLGDLYLGSGRTKSDFLKDNESAYDLEDIRKLSATMCEENTTYSHERAWAFQLSDEEDDSMESAVLNKARLQVFEDVDVGEPVDYRVSYMNITIIWPDALIDSVKENFWKGVDSSDADVQALSFSNPLSGAGKSLWGSGSDVWGAMGDGMNSATSGSLGLVAFSFEGAGDLISSGWGGMGTSLSSISKGALQFTNTAIGSIVSGAGSLVLNGGRLLLNTVGKIIMLPFSLLMAGTLLIKVVMIILVILTVIVLAVAFKRYRNKHPSKGGTGIAKILPTPGTG